MQLSCFPSFNICNWSLCVSLNLFVPDPIVSTTVLGQYYLVNIYNALSTIWWEFGCPIHYIGIMVVLIFNIIFGDSLFGKFMVSLVVWQTSEFIWISDVLFFSLVSDVCTIRRVLYSLNENRKGHWWKCKTIQFL